MTTRAARTTPSLAWWSHPTGVTWLATQPYNHYSLLATIEYTLGVGRLGLAAGAKAMTDLLAP
jgi:hypothetical protein